MPRSCSSVPGTRAELRRRATTTPSVLIARAIRRGALPDRARCSRANRATPPTASSRPRSSPISAITRESIEVYERVLKEYPEQPKIWMSYGHSLKTAGRSRRGHRGVPARHLDWSRTSGRRTGAWRTSRPSVSSADGAHGAARTARAHGPRQRLAAALRVRARQGARGSGATTRSPSRTMRGQRAAPKPCLTARRPRRPTSQQSMEVFTREFFAERAGAGTEAADPIFIVGLPRAGSTLLEQILASHSLVEGTMELPDSAADRADLGDRPGAPGGLPPHAFARLSRERLRELGEHYLRETRVQRKTAAPFFIDKMPNNFLHVGLIHLILPNAHIIDARRHPLGCCFSGFKQHFARGQNFTYDLERTRPLLPRLRASLMAHFDRGAAGARASRPLRADGRGHRGARCADLLDYCGLPFEEAACASTRTSAPCAPRAPSRCARPIFREGIEQWRHFEPWLGPLKESARCRARDAIRGARIRSD